MARYRKKKKREDYRSGGRVSLQEGGDTQLTPEQLAAIRVAQGKGETVTPETGVNPIKPIQHNIKPGPIKDPAPDLPDIREEDILEQSKLDAVHQYQQDPQQTKFDSTRFPGVNRIRNQYQSRASNNQPRSNTIPSLPKILPDKDLKQRFEDERAERIIRAGETAEQIAGGDIPEGTLREADLARVPITPDSISDAVQMGEIPQVEGTKIQPVSAEQVAVMDDINKAKTPEQLQAAKFTASKVLQSPDVQAAQGSLSDGALAQAVGVDRVPTIDSSDVVVEEGAVTDRVVGTLSDGAKAQAAVTAGTTLGRLSRAKKQLRKAGMSESDIADLGNDPSLLEDKLTDFTEAERGVIEGLPQEALVSTQLNSLLEGVENGNIPPWASPAVSAVEQMLAARGLSASTVGKENLLNAIIQSAVPIAQANAQAIQQSVSQQRGIDAQVALKEAEFKQQTALSNADKVFNLDMAQFSADSQVNLANSKFFQTVSLTEASMEQQGIMQDAALLSQANLAEADFNTKLGIQNAQAFLSMDMSNLDKRQQSNLLKAQQEQQRLLTNQAADNASKQFNAVSENQTNQFMTSMSTQISQFNAQQQNAAEQFNAQQKNAAEARRAARDTELNKANAAIMNQVAQFNTQLDFNREQWNKQNEQAVRQSNVAWRRQANLADTAAQNAINQQNVQNAFGLTQSALSFSWQELRDQADYDFRWATDSANRKTQAMIAAASAEGDAAKTWSNNFRNASGVIDNIFGGG